MMGVLGICSISPGRMKYGGGEVVWFQWTLEVVEGD